MPLEGLKFGVGKVQLYFFFNKGLRDDTYPNEDEQDSEDRQVQTEDITYPEGQGENAQDKPETADLDAVQEADAHESQYNQSCPDEPGAFRDPLIRYEPETTNHDQEQPPADGV